MLTEFKNQISSYVFCDVNIRLAEVMGKMILIFLTTCFVSRSSSEIIVETTTGPVQGVSALTADVEAFLGIPYAEPPVGDLRFARPLPKKPWKETYNASNLPPPCMQFEMDLSFFTPDYTKMSEDCLFLNIWMPKADYGHRLRPVIFYIHPGGFAIGSTDTKVQDGSHFASRGDVVVVTMNYRLGVLGFFLAFTEEADGNMGIYDQIMALQWVKDNAKAFGGDPENIALMGLSAGAFSVSMHMVSPLSKHLFKRAIVHSGAMVHPYLQDDNVKLFGNSEALAASVGCSNKTSNLSSNPKLVVECLKGKPAKVLVDEVFNFVATKPFMFRPRVNDAILPMSPHELLRRGNSKKDIQVLTGIDENEGSVFLAISLRTLNGKNRTYTMTKKSASMFGALAARLFGPPRSNDLVKAYIKNVTDHTSDGYMKVVSDITGDTLIACSTVFFADFVSLNSKNVYFYKFNYRSPSTPLPEWTGTTHGDEFQYVFGNPFHANFTDEEIELNHNLMDRWSAFAKTGNPDIPDQLPWSPYSYKRPLYLHIEKEESIKWRPLSRCEHWREKYKSEIDGHILETDRNQDSPRM